MTISAQRYYNTINVIIILSRYYSNRFGYKNPSEPSLLYASRSLSCLGHCLMSRWHSWKMCENKNE